jgi:hypothetical protein
MMKNGAQGLVVGDRCSRTARTARTKKTEEDRRRPKKTEEEYTLRLSGFSAIGSMKGPLAPFFANCGIWYTLYGDVLLLGAKWHV